MLDTTQLQDQKEVDFSFHPQGGAQRAGGAGGCAFGFSVRCRVPFRSSVSKGKDDADGIFGEPRIPLKLTFRILYSVRPP